MKFRVFAALLLAAVIGALYGVSALPDGGSDHRSRSNDGGYLISPP